jgi:hypothetical protein
MKRRTKKLVHNLLATLQAESLQRARERIEAVANDAEAERKVEVDRLKKQARDAIETPARTGAGTPWLWRVSMSSGQRAPSTAHMFLMKTRRWRMHLLAADLSDHLPLCMMHSLSSWKHCAPARSGFPDRNACQNWCRNSVVVACVNVKRSKSAIDSPYVSDGGPRR